MEKPPRQVYTNEFRQQAVELITREGLSLAEAVRRLSITPKDADQPVQPCQSGGSNGGRHDSVTYRLRLTPSSSDSSIKPPERRAWRSLLTAHLISDMIPLRAHHDRNVCAPIFRPGISLVFTSIQRA